MKAIAIILTLVGPLAAADSAPSTAAEQQRAAIEVQRQAIARRVPPPSPINAAGFFLLPPLTHRALTPGPAYVPPACDPMPKAEIDRLLQEAATREGVKLDLLQAVVSQESGSRPCAVSPKGAMGLMQLMPDTAAQFGVTDPFDARQNIDSGARLLKQLLERYKGNVSLALGAYNAGPARVDAAGGVPQIEETLRYVQSILGRLPAN